MYGVEYAPRIFIFRADARPAGAGPGTHPKKTGGGTLATPTRTRPKREGARGGRGAEKVDSPSAAATPPPGPGRARTAELATARRPRPMPTPARRDRTAAGRFRRLTRGPSSGPPDARPARQSDAAPQLRRAASRGAARRGLAAGARGRPSRGASRVCAALAALTDPKRWLCAPALAERSAALEGF